MRNTLLALAVGVIAIVLPGQANAVVTYTLVDQVYTFNGTTLPQGRLSTSFSFSVSDAAVARGRYSLGIDDLVPPGQQPSPFLKGDIADFVSMNVAGEAVTLDRPVGSGSGPVLSVSFAGTDGTPISLYLDIGVGGERLRLLDTINEPDRLSGSYSSNLNNCGFSTVECLVSGRLELTSVVPDSTVVPEPMSLALLGIGLLGILVARRHWA